MAREDKFIWEGGEGITITNPPATDADELQGEIDRIDAILREAGDLVTDGASPLYVSRRVLNAGEILRWAKAAGFTDLLAPADLHVTIAYSRAPVDWMDLGEPWDEKVEIAEGGPRMLDTFGEGAQVLLFASRSLQWRHEDMRRAGASWDHGEYRPHITLSYGAMPAGVSPYTGRILLGPEIFEDIKT